MITVERVKVEMFEPVRITITKREEVDALWHLVNNSICISVKDYCKDRKINSNEIDAIATGLWQAIDKIHRPEETEKITL